MSFRGQTLLSLYRCKTLALSAVTEAGTRDYRRSMLTVEVEESFIGQEGSMQACVACSEDNSVFSRRSLDELSAVVFLCMIHG